MLSSLKLSRLHQRLLFTAFRQKIMQIYMFLLLILNTTYSHLRRCYSWEIYSVRSLRMVAAMIWFLFSVIVLILYVLNSAIILVAEQINYDLTVLILHPKSSEMCQKQLYLYLISALHHPSVTSNVITIYGQKDTVIHIDFILTFLKQFGTD